MNELAATSAVSAPLDIVPEGVDRLVVVARDGENIDAAAVTNALERDLVVLIPKVSAERADRAMHGVAHRLGLGGALELQARFASFKGHRHNVGKYFMSVDRRKDYQCHTPHCEGTSFVNLQLAAFHCYENSTDGGETILFNVDDASAAWSSLRERVTRGRGCARPFAAHEIARAKALYQVRLPDDLVRDDDHVLHERPSSIPGLTLIDALASPRKTRSVVFGRDMYVYWATIAYCDHDSLAEYARLLRHHGLLKEPPGGLTLDQMNLAPIELTWRSGVRYTRLFSCKITRKLAPGDLVIFNNVSWAHAASNWTPGSGCRNIAAAFA